MVYLVKPQSSVILKQILDVLIQNLASDTGSTMMGPVPLDLIVAPSTNAVTFRIRLNPSASGYPWHVNRDGSNTTNTSDGGGVLSSWTITEVDGGQVTLNQTDVTLDV